MLLFLLIVFLCIPLNLIIHEVGHMVCLIVNNIQIKAVFLPYIYFIKSEKWEIKPWKNFCNACIIPNMPEINNEFDYYKIKKNYIKSLIYGPLVTLTILIILIICFIITIYSVNKYLKVGIFINILLNLNIFLSVFKNTEDRLGDFIAYKKLQYNNLLSDYYLLDYLLYSNNNKNKIIKSDYFFNQINNNLSLLIRDTDNNLNMYILKNYLTIYMAGYVDHLLPNIEKLEVIYLDTIENWLNKNEFDTVLLLLRIIQYEYCKDNKILAKELYTKYITTLIVEDHLQQLDFYKKQTEYLLEMIDSHKLNTFYSLDKRSFYSIYEILYQYSNIDIDIFKKNRGYLYE